MLDCLLVPGIDEVMPVPVAIVDTTTELFFVVVEVRYLCSGKMLSRQN